MGGRRKIPIRKIKILFVDLKTRKFVKVYNEQNSGAMLYAQGLPECEVRKRGWGLKVGNEGIRRERRGCG